ncbi:hypothetical protein UlMin_002347 [Ulmus minor]
MTIGGSHHDQGQQEVPFKTTKESLQVLLLHGNLDIWIKEAKNLPSKDIFQKIMQGPFSNSTSDPYATISAVGAVVGRTSVIEYSENPFWDQHFKVNVAHYAAEVLFVVKVDVVLRWQIIGAVRIPVEHLCSGQKVEGSFPILSASGKPCKPGSVLTLSIQYTSVDKVSFNQPRFGELATYFPQRKGGQVTLYQDAHAHDCGLPNFELDNGLEYKQSSCCDDIFDAISQARHLIYIGGWSFYHKVKLLRGKNAEESMLGDLLKKKALEGVTVLLLLWNDPSSRNFLGLKETSSFFEDSLVRVLLRTEAIYSHHQKTLIVDTDAGAGKRKITAFVGGLDFSLGRYDTPEHPLFGTLKTAHADDFHNPNFKKPGEGCPREPWHDLHCRIDGPAAYDVHTNFEERWLKASEQLELQKLKSSYDGALLNIDDFVSMANVPCLREDNPETWNVQIFRSIDSNSAKGFPENSKEATNKNLVRWKNVSIDMSIHTAYVMAIRAAENFIYIESQYFLVSSYNWDSFKHLGANNLIPMEIALKIVNKIKANERFSAYIVIPMWPEGDPTSMANKTMQMMYQMIYVALREAGLENQYEPQDYLNFFCLGNCEAQRAKLQTSKLQRTLARRSRRFMIYYVILGSANINERSMDGTRDTEIAMGAYQLHHTLAKKDLEPLNGQVHGYRMSLWAEHIGMIEERFKQPKSVECVRRVRYLSEQNWRQFVADEATEMKGHLMKYPVEVDRTGKVKKLPGFETFPDLGGNIMGTYLGGNIMGTRLGGKRILENLTI